MQFEKDEQIRYDTPVALEDYLDTLKTRKKESHVYQSFQLAGLELAQILGDQAHKALYIKLAKEYDAQALRELAKSISEQKNVKQRGAYFMAVFTRDRAKFRKHSSSRNDRKHIPKRQSRRGKSPARKNKAV